ncbi:MAG: rhomboid family intramembrane serine protease, partial [Saccharofermentans sp.]|nr:rhomboid family intramembrane serine protease [Saccharofermentans sp.]
MMLASYWPSIVYDKQYYRIATSMFLHFGNTHIMNNMIILFAIGSKAEMLLGKFRYILLYFISGLLAGTVSMVYNMINGYLTVSAGASSAIFGLTGAMLRITFTDRHRRGGLTVKQMLLFSAMSLYGGLTDASTD